MSAYQHPQLVAFAGEAHHGKSASADFLIAQHGFERVSFADPIKEMLMTLGLSRAQLYDPKQKELPCVKLRGKTPRQAMQTLGTDWGRQMIYDDLWVDAACRKMEQMMAKGCRLVIDDLRFDNEAEAVHRLGGKIFHVARPGLKKKVSLWARWRIHASERGVSAKHIDLYLVNDTTLSELYNRIDAAIRRPLGRPLAA
jgi:hypothetical protein